MYLSVFRSTFFRHVLSFLLVVGLSACSLFGGDKEKDEEREKARLLTEKQLYERIQEMLDEERFELAVKNLQLLESRFPFGAYADQSQLEIIYAYYKNNDEQSAVAAAERFLRLHPQHRDADYAWYMKGLANYSIKPGVLSRFYDHDFSARDVQPARRSFRDFQEFLRLYPDSTYAADARVRMIHIRHILARHEVQVANYYLKRRAYTAAINRARGVVENYQQTEAIGDALAVLVYCYGRLDMPDDAELHATILRENFPGHEALRANGEFVYSDVSSEGRRSLLNRVSLGLLDAPRAPQFDSRA